MDSVNQIDRLLASAVLGICAVVDGSLGRSTTFDSYEEKCYMCERNCTCCTPGLKWRCCPFCSAPEYMDQKRELLATVASLYYRLNLSQSEIASRLDVSISKVSRLLKEAHDKGIVEIKIHVPVPRDLLLEQEFIKRFSLKDVYILQTGNPAHSDTLLNAVGGLARGYVERITSSLPDGSSIGIAWGTSVHATVNALPDHSSQNINVVPLLGGVGASVVDGPDLARMVAMKLGGRHYDLHAPVLVERPEVRDAILSEPAVHEGILRARSVRLAITGIGSVQDESSSFLRAGLLSRNDLAHLRNQGVVGEMCGHFFDIQGRYEGFEINNRIIGLEPRDLRNIAHVLAIARGLSKANSILGALNGHYLTVLATDDATARAILEEERSLS